MKNLGMEIFTSLIVWGHICGMTLNMYAFSLGTFLAPLNFFFIFFSAFFIIYTIKNIYVRFTYPNEFIEVPRTIGDDVPVKVYKKKEKTKETKIYI